MERNNGEEIPGAARASTLKLPTYIRLHAAVRDTKKLDFHLQSP